jgi:hypothetical protein
MCSQVRRRRFLTVVSGFAASAAGCLSEDHNNYALPEKCGGPSYRLYADFESGGRTVAVEPQTATAENRSAATATGDTTVEGYITPADLSDEQQRIEKQAIEGEMYYECDSPSDALASFEDLIYASATRERSGNYRASGGAVYNLMYCKLDECAD